MWKLLKVILDKTEKMIDDNNESKGKFLIKNSGSALHSTRKEKKQKEKKSLAAYCKL